MAIINERQRLIMVPEHGNISHLHKLCHFLHTLQCMYSKKIQQCCYKQPIGHSCAHLWYIRRYLNERRKELGVKKIFFFNVKDAIGYQDYMYLSYDKNISATTDFSNNDRNSN